MGNLRNLEDQELVSLYINGQEEAFQILLLRHKNKLFNYINSKLRDRALSEDVFQDVFFKIIQTLKKGNYNEEGKFLPWAMRIAHNLVVDYFRKNNKVHMISESSTKKEDFDIFSVLDMEEENVQDIITRKELENQMILLVDYLPKSQRDILVMRIFKEMSFKDIADKEDISINTALGRMRYALINLRKLIDKHNVVTHY